jgi:hypothetical protein
VLVVFLWFFLMPAVINLSLASADTSRSLGDAGPVAGGDGNPLKNCGSAERVGRHSCDGGAALGRRWRRPAAVIGKRTLRSPKDVSREMGATADRENLSAGDGLACCVYAGKPD